MRKDSPANARRVKITLEEPAAGVGSQGQLAGIPVLPVYTVVSWAQREDFTDSQEVGRVNAGGWNDQTKTVDRVSTPEERYHQLVVELPSSLYTQGFSLRLRAASYLNDSSWTRSTTAPALPCPALLGNGTNNLPCPPFDEKSASPPAPQLVTGEYVVPATGPARDAFDDSLLRRGVPIIGSIRVTMKLPEYSALAFEEATLDAMKLRPPTPKCLFTQIEWSPDSNFARLFVGARPACSVPGAEISATIDNFADNLESLSSSIFSYPKIQPLLFFRARAYLDDSSTTSMVNPALTFPGVLIREPQNIGDEAFAPQLLNDTIVDEWTLTLRLGPPALRNPKTHILFLEVQVSDKLHFRELTEVMYNVDPEAPACSRARNRSTVSDLLFANTLIHASDEINLFRDIDHNAPSGYVPGCLTSDKIRVRVSPTDSAAPLNINVTFPESIYQQSYYFRVSAILSDSSVILQDQKYNNWGAFSRGCQHAKEYLQSYV
jgi:hypothetical protein